MAKYKVGRTPAELAMSKSAECGIFPFSAFVARCWFVGGYDLTVHNSASLTSPIVTSNSIILQKKCALLLLLEFKQGAHLSSSQTNCIDALNE